MAKIAADNAAAGAASASAAAIPPQPIALNAYTDANYIRNSMLSIDGAIVQDATGRFWKKPGRQKHQLRRQIQNWIVCRIQLLTCRIHLPICRIQLRNIQNNMGVDTSPPVVELSTLSGARATSGNSIKLIVNLLDNQPGPFTYSIDGVLYNPCHLITV
jgi:hypothetical protein